MPTEFKPNYSFSMYGEDSLVAGVLNRICQMSNIETIDNMSYMDIGCYHPMEDNNTFFLYELGKRGTLVDPNPYLRPEVELYRKDDLFLNSAVNVTSGKEKYYMLDETNFSNTLVKDFADRVAKAQDRKIKEIMYVECNTLEEIFDMHIEKFGEEPNIVNIDIEGLDHAVIASYSFKYRPLLFLIEDTPFGAFDNSPQRKFMETKGYKPVAANFLTTVYIDTQNKYYNSLFKVGPEE